MPAKTKDKATITAAGKMLTDMAGYGHNLSDLFRDFVNVVAISLQNGFEPQSDAWHTREAEYEAIVKRYDKRVIDGFATCMGMLTLIAADKPSDHLGELYMSLGHRKNGLGSKGLGQFFTPFAISRSMAAMTITKELMDQAIAEKGYLYMNEPTCGSGGMVVAAAETVRNLGFDPSQHLRVVAQDIDRLCCRMTYISCCLHQIPATIVWGDTLKFEERSSELTPALWIAMAKDRLRPAA